MFDIWAMCANDANFELTPKTAIDSPNARALYAMKMILRHLSTAAGKNWLLLLMPLRRVVFVGYFSISGLLDNKCPVLILQSLPLSTDVINYETLAAPILRRKNHVAPGIISRTFD